MEEEEKKKEQKMIKLTIGKVILTLVLLVLLVFLGVNIYNYINEKPNIYSSIRNLFTKEDNETEKTYKIFSDRTSSHKTI